MLIKRKGHLQHQNAKVGAGLILRSLKLWLDQISVSTPLLQF